MLIWLIGGKVYYMCVYDNDPNQPFYLLKYMCIYSSLVYKNKIICDFWDDIYTVYY